MHLNKPAFKLKLEIKHDEPMTKKLITVILIIIFVQSAKAQFGLGATGGLLNPGLMKSDSSVSQFNTGWGYELFFTHNVIKIADTLQLKARWSYRQYINEIELPYILDTWFTFKHLTINFLVDIYRFNDFALYAGLGASLVSVRANKDFFDYSDTIFVPELDLGLKWILSQHYNLFSELSFQYGNLNDVFEEDIPVTGIRFVIGAVMYLSEEK